MINFSSSYCSLFIFLLGLLFVWVVVVSRAKELSSSWGNDSLSSEKDALFCSGGPKPLFHGRLLDKGFY